MLGLNINHSEIADIESVKNAIKWREVAIRNLQEGLPYADHGAYGQDKERIRNYQREVTYLKNIEQELASANTRT